MQHTNQYQFNLIESGDTFSPQPLNENAEKMEQALAAAKAEAAAATQALAATVPKITMGSYTGKGTSGQENKNSLTFGFKPYAVLVSQESSSSYYGVWVYGTTTGRSFTSESAMKNVHLDWSETGLSWYYDDNGTSSGAGYQLNANGKLYNYIAIGLN